MRIVTGAACATVLLLLLNLAWPSRAVESGYYPMKLSKQHIAAIIAEFKDGEGARVENIHAETINSYSVDLRSANGRCTRFKLLFPKNSLKPLFDGGSYECN